MSPVLTYTGRLTVTACWCGIRYAVPDELWVEHARSHTHQIYCPLGHAGILAGETDAERERRLRKYAEDRLAAERARADGAEASLRTTKGHVTRLRKRIAAGVCPWCTRHFENVARHVAVMHAGQPLEAES